MNIEKLDGFTADGFGNIIGGEKDLVDGDVMRIDGSIEQRYCAPVVTTPPIKPPQVTPPTISQDELAILKTAITIIQKLATAS